MSEDEEYKELVSNLIKRANNKEGGRVITFKDLALLALTKLTDKDLEKLQENSLSEMEKVQRALLDHNKKTGSNLSLGEFLIKKLGIN